MYKHLKRMQKNNGVENVRIIIATDVVISELSGDLSFIHDGFHRCGPTSTPICVTRYPVHPKGCRAHGKAMGKGVCGNREGTLRGQYQRRLRLLDDRYTGGVLQEIIVEISCLSSVLDEVLQNCYATIARHEHALPKRIYDCHPRRSIRLDEDPAFLTK